MQLGALKIPGCKKCIWKLYKLQYKEQMYQLCALEYKEQMNKLLALWHRKLRHCALQYR